MSNSNDSHCPQNLCSHDYLLLNADNASIYDLIRFLWSKDHRRKLIDSPSDIEEEVRSFRYKWLVFVSIVMQKLFSLINKPMTLTGYVIISWLNLLNDNDGILSLVLNFIKGKVVRPNNQNETHRSMIGNLDTRLDLDSSITPAHPKYSAQLSWMAAKLSYENSAFIKSVVEQHWKMKLIGSYSFWNEFRGNNTTHAMMLGNVTDDKDLTVVAFRGTEPFTADDWCTDMDISWFGLSGVGRVHAGFMKALGLQKINNHVGWPIEIDMSSGKPMLAYYTIRQILRQITRDNKNARFILTGHSLGAALAILYASILILHEEKELLDRLEGVYTYGQPRVGDEEFGKFMKKKLVEYNIKYMRYVYCNDMVPRLPYDDQTLLFKHFGPCLYYNSLYKGQVLPEEPNKNYFSLIWMIPKYLTAIWEIIRGFVLPHLVWGMDYKECWCERMFRLVGLLIPGLAAHGPQDYTNLIRLGTLSLPDLHQD